ncbi:MAG: prepilin-type N-terminal cleavage/methylation domain-containing protein [Planctomycetota bacterium]
MFRRARRTRQGFTLVEMMIAITVLAVAVLSTFITQISSHNLMRTSRETNVAMADAEAAMDRLLLLPVDEIPVAGSLFAAGQPVAAFTNLHLDNETIVPTYPGFAGVGAIPDPLQIVLTVTWNDYAGRQRIIRLSSMKTR